MDSYSNAKQVKQYKKMLSWYSKAKKKTKGKSTKNKIKILAKYIMKRCRYDFDKYYNRKVPEYESTCYDDRGVVLRKRAVCAGYAIAFNKLCRYAGVKSEYVESRNHAWNLVKVGKKWYHYDTTWNDCVHSQKAFSFMGKNKIKKKEYRLMIASKAFKKKHPVAKKSLKW